MALSSKRPEGRHSATVMALARILFEKMEHLDPGSAGGFLWEELSPREIEYHALCVEAILERASLVRLALADDDVVFRQPHAAE